VPPVYSALVLWNIMVTPQAVSVQTDAFRQLYHWLVVIQKAAGVSCQKVHIREDKSRMSFYFGSHKN